MDKLITWVLKGAIAEMLQPIRAQVAQLEATQKEILIQMSLTGTKVARLKTVTDNLAAELKKLRDKLASADPATPEELAQFDALLDHLDAMGTDPADPLNEGGPLGPALAGQPA